jgi:phosphohistidine swiveling domain-containing protein
MQPCQKLVKQICALSLDDMGEYGAKAARLGEVARLEYSVPEGFCLSGAAYENFLLHNGLDNAIAGILAYAESAGPNGLQSCENRITDAFCAGDVPLEIVEAILYSFSSLGAVPVAVRSSSTCEDAPDLSFAGQHDTFLDVMGEKDLLLSVQRCWASLFTARCIDYARRYNIRLLSCKMGVIIQRMVNASQAGVLFTANPITGDPDTFILEVQKGDPPGTHHLSLYPATDNNIPAEWTQLRDMGLRLDDRFSAYQDMEWAIADGSVFILQARPATSIPPYAPVTWQDPEDARQCWDLEAKEGVPPRLLMPHTWYHQSRSQELTDAFFSKVDKRFLPCWTIRERFVCGYSYRRWEYVNYPSYDDDVPGWKRFWQSLARLRVALYLDREFRALLQDRGPQLEALNKVDLSNLSPADLIDHLNQIADLHWLFMAQCGRLTFVYKVIPDILHRLHRRWIGDDAGFWPLLITGEDVVVHRDRELWRLARDTAGQLRLREERFREFFRKYRHLFLEGHPLADALDMLELQENPSAAWAAMNAWDADPGFDFDRHLKELLDARDEAEKRVLAILNPVKRWIYRKILRLSNRYIPVKIDRDAPVFLCWVLERDVVLEVGRRLQEEGATEDGKDGQFLSKSEIEDWCKGNIASANLGNLIAVRKMDFLRWARYSPPEAIGATAKQQETEPMLPVDQSRTLYGVAISPGIAAGTARIINTVSEAGEMKKGEILVCREPLFELSPLFGVVAAVVAEAGGMLDHSGILVREYGVPAVFQVHRATHLIQTGEEIVVDGNSGTIRREKDQN